MKTGMLAFPIAMLITSFQKHRVPSRSILEIGISACIDPTTEPTKNENENRYSDILINNDIEYTICEHFPAIFQDIRQICGYNQLFNQTFIHGSFTDFKSNSLGSRNNKVEFYWSSNKHFMIKSLSTLEYEQLNKILSEYHAHVSMYPNTLLSKFCGLYSYQLKADQMKHKSRPLSNMLFSRRNVSGDTSDVYLSKRPDRYYLIMKNAFDPNVTLERQYDLKGSFLGRRTDNEEGESKYRKKHVWRRQGWRRKPTSPYNDSVGPYSHRKSRVLKDLNFIESSDSKLSLKPDDRKRFISQLLADVSFLQSISVMDYSLLLGVAYPVGEPAQVSDSKRNSCDRVSNVSRGMSVWPFFRNIFSKSNSGPISNKGESLNRSLIWEGYHQPSSNNHWCNANQTEVYYISIIDFLQPYNMKKWVETIGKSLIYKPNQFSSVGPVAYARRFVSFITSKVLL